MLISYFKTEPADREEVFNRLLGEYISIMEGKKFN